MANWKVKLTHDGDQWIGKRTRLGKDAWMGHSDLVFDHKRVAIRKTKQWMDSQNRSSGSDYACLLICDKNRDVRRLWFSKNYRKRRIEPFKPEDLPDSISSRLEIRASTRWVWIHRHTGGGRTLKFEYIEDAGTTKEDVLNRRSKLQRDLGIRAIDVWNTDGVIEETHYHPLVRRYEGS